MDSDQYLSERLNNQIDWYDRKSQYNQKRSQFLRILEILLAGFIPLLSGLGGENIVLFRIITGVLGVGVIIISGILSIFKFQENWLEYRSTCEMLKREKYLFETKTSPYNSDNPLPLLVDRVESIILSENKNWLKYISEQRKENKSVNQ